MKLLDGDNVLYHYFKQDLLGEDSLESRALMRKLLTNLSIWLPLKFYQRLPVLLPFVVRDARCRKAVNKIAEEWGTSNVDGYFRDDNTLIKSIPRSFKIASKNGTYSGGKLGRGFVTCHIWRVIPDSSKLASEDPHLNSFIPNLVWLPRQISKFTDREGSFAQRYLQTLSRAIYHNVKMDSDRKQFVDNIWGRIPADPDITITKKDMGNLSFFHLTDEDVEKRVRRVLDDIALLKSPVKQKKLYCSRYLPSLETIEPSRKLRLLEILDNYAMIIT